MPSLAWTPPLSRVRRVKKDWPRERFLRERDNRVEIFSFFGFVLLAVYVSCWLWLSRDPARRFVEKRMILLFSFFLIITLLVFVANFEQMCCTVLRGDGFIFGSILSPD